MRHIADRVNGQAFRKLEKFKFVVRMLVTAPFAMPGDLEVQFHGDAVNIVGDIGVADRFRKFLERQVLILMAFRRLGSRSQHEAGQLVAEPQTFGNFLAADFGFSHARSL